MVDILRNLSAVVLIMDVLAVCYIFLYMEVWNWQKSFVVQKWLVRILGWLSIIAVCIVCFTAGRAHAETLCMRLNNPMCITGSRSNPWEGQLRIAQHGLVHFQTKEHGLRAGAIVLANMKLKHGITSIEALVKRYCEGNHTEYAKHLNRVTGAKLTRNFDILAYMPELMSGIIYFENGYCPWEISELEKYEKFIEEYKNGTPFKKVESENRKTKINSFRKEVE